MHSHRGRYSDNQGETWTIGAELGPKGSTSPPHGVLTWDEDTLTELVTSQAIQKIYDRTFLSEMDGL